MSHPTAYCGCTSQDQHEAILVEERRAAYDPSRRLGHCTPVWGGHSLACDRDGTYCGLTSTHEGPCKPHDNRR